MKRIYHLLIRPNGVSWYSFKDTMKDSCKVAVFSGVWAVILIAADVVFGLVLKLVF